MDARTMTMGERPLFDDELHRLRAELDEAWWNEESLDRIEQLEREIRARRRTANGEKTTRP